MKKYKPREWSNTALYQRDMVVGLLKEVFLAADDFAQVIRDGDALRETQLDEVASIKEKVFFALMILKETGADVDTVELINRTNR